MPKNLLRIVAFLLVPVMVAQSGASPALAGTLSLGERAGVRPPSVFTSQALAPDLVGALRPQLDKTPRVAALDLEKLARQTRGLTPDEWNLLIPTMRKLLHLILQGKRQINTIANHMESTAHTVDIGLRLAGHFLKAVYERRVRGRHLNIKSLTTREKEILRALALGYNSSDLGDPASVGGHLSRVRIKSALNAHEQKGLEKSFFDLIELVHRSNFLEEKDQPAPALLDGIEEVVQNLRNPALKTLFVELGEGLSEMQIADHLGSSQNSVSQQGRLIAALINLNKKIKRSQGEYRLAEMASDVSAARLAALLLRVYRPQVFAILAEQKAIRERPPQIPIPVANKASKASAHQPAPETRRTEVLAAWQDLRRRHPKVGAIAHALALEHGKALSEKALRIVERYIANQSQLLRRGA